MTRIAAAIFAGSCLVTTLHAQQNIPGSNVPPNTPGYTQGKSEDAGERRKQSKQQGKVRAPGGDAAGSAEISGIPNDRGAVAGEQRKQTRDARRPNKRRTTQGGTPDDPLAPAK